MTMTHSLLYYPEALKDQFRAILQTLYKLEESIPFRSISELTDQCVDLNSQPMDLSEVEYRLNTDMYSDPWTFVDDVWKLFENAWAYNRSTSKLYQCCTKVAERFEIEMNKCMRSLGFCCGKRYVFTPSSLECYAKKCQIERNAKYYNYNDEYILCSKCYLENFNSSIEIENKSISRSQFAEKKNDKIIPENFVYCRQCKRKFHQICILYIEQTKKEKFICNFCDSNADSNRKNELLNFSARKLATSKLSDWLQFRIDSFLKTKNVENGNICVRVVSSSRKITSVKTEMKRKFSGARKFPNGFPYISKTIFVFQEIDGVDVALFSMYVQEYDSSCSEPNNRRAYISYLDSVNYFQPKEIRTDFYFEIVLGYIDYVKTLGYKMVHVWACPPPDGDDYLFYRHPPNQKSLDHTKLEQWYMKLLEKGIGRGIILKNLDVLPDSNSTSVIYKLPYFENDFWPNVLEETLKKFDEMGLEDKNKIVSEVVDDSVLETLLIKQLHCIHDEQKEVFFVFQLHSEEELPKLLPIVDPDPLITCELIENRDSFLIYFRDNNYEFSSIRRARFSSLILLHELHTNNYGKSITYSCNSCSKTIISGYHCISCEDFDLCLNCWSKNRHEHDMEFISSKENNQTVVNLSEPEPDIKTDAENLLHSRLCKDKNCDIRGCSRIRKLISHFTICPTNVKSNCPPCKRLLTMCWHHAKLCSMKNCVVPTCERIKMKLTR